MLLILILTAKGTAQDRAAAQSQSSAVPPPAFGLAFVNSAETPSSPQRIRRGVDAGAGMDRFPLYWDRIETGYGQFDWAAQDNALRANQSQGLPTLAVLLGTPGHYFPRTRSYRPMPALGGSFVHMIGQVQSQATCQSWQGPPPPSGLYNPIFVDGTDMPAPGKAINADNYWARFVNRAVNRYRPGGDAGLAVRHWEIWNEPDLCHFWSGTVADYARLLKVAYLVIKQSDPEATVIWGGLAHFANARFLAELIAALRADPLAAQFAGFFDAAGSHHYSLSWHSYDYTLKVRNALNAAGWAAKPIWITESGVPVCNDYPGPACPSDWRASPTEQAAYIWQNVAYTRLAGGGPIFHFMLHDDCGNVVAVNSPDGFGLSRNESSSYCSPANAETRLAYTAYQLATRYLSDVDLLWGDVQMNRTARRVAFYHPASGERRTLVWSIVGADTTVDLAATGNQLRQIALDGSAIDLTPTNGSYTIALPAATDRNWPSDGGYDIGIYGAPYLLIERDSVPPVTTITLPPLSPSTFGVGWQASDAGSGVVRVDLWVRVDGGAWQLWAADQSAVGTLSFKGEVGRRYEFAALSTDRAGNVQTELVAGAQTTVAVDVQASGRVIDTRGMPVIDVAVHIGAAQTQTDETGAFAMQVPVGNWDIGVGEQIVHRARTFADSTQLLLLYASAPEWSPQWRF